MNGNTRVKNSVSELGKSSGRRGLSFEDFVKYRTKASSGLRAMGHVSNDGVPQVCKYLSLYLRSN